MVFSNASSSHEGRTTSEGGFTPGARAHCSIGNKSCGEFARSQLRLDVPKVSRRSTAFRRIDSEWAAQLQRWSGMSTTRSRLRTPTRRRRSPRELRRAAPLFAALGDNVRLSLVNRLCARGPMSTMRLSEGSGVTRQAVSKHLEVLEAAGVVRSMRVGRERLWEVDPSELRHAQDWLGSISRDWTGALKAYAG